MASRSRATKVVITILLLVIVCVGLAWMFILGKQVPFVEQQKLYEMIRNVAGIMFAVFGLWIGLLYPELRKRVFSRGRQVSNEDPHDIAAKDEDRQADHLLQPFFVSLFIVLVTVVVDIASPLLKRVEWLIQQRSLLRGVSYCLIGVLALAQIVSILQAMKITDGLKATISRGRKVKEVKDRTRQNRNG